MTDSCVSLGPHPAGASRPTRAGGDQSRTAAFFDLDKTIIATSSAFAFGREFLHNGLISPAEALQLSLAKASYMFSGLSSEGMDTTRDQLTAMVTGWSVDEVRSIARETMHHVVTPSIYAEARELIRAHRAAGHHVVIVSASAAVLVDIIAEELGVEHVIATELAEEDGRFTGEVLFYCKGQNKAVALERTAAAEDIDLRTSYAYSDSATDIPMLEKVSHPVAVNPDRQLKRHALAHEWEIRSFKDPVPLLPAPTAKEIGIGASVLAGTAAVIGAGLWLTQHPGRPGPPKRGPRRAS
ncbi:HAD family hydrolase [uncultured Corynebacterium sp.]|uniref:HAD family hydrolase n=1 Tax=uncultured Corynebacterium sp. TaxID=159447 RepID=UPI0025CC0C79|nr:HAD family hydrolase [uncultured Corynebacterium sp.]